MLLYGGFDKVIAHIMEFNYKVHLEWVTVKPFVEASCQ